jgi:hypothetical protein
MRLERMLCRFLLPGESVVKDEVLGQPKASDLGASLSPQAGETVLAFRPVDNDPELCGPAGGVAIADALFLWKSNQYPSQDPGGHPVLLAVECKHSVRDAHAFNQVLGLLAAVVGGMEPSAVGRVGGIILTSSPAPSSEVARWKRQAFRKTGVLIGVISVPKGSTTDVRPYLQDANACRVTDLVRGIGTAFVDD